MKIQKKALKRNTRQRYFLLILRTVVTQTKTIPTMILNKKKKGGGGGGGGGGETVADWSHSITSLSHTIPWYQLETKITLKLTRKVKMFINKIRHTQQCTIYIHKMLSTC